MDIIVTTPKSEMANAAREAADCIAGGGGEYFRRFALRGAPDVVAGDLVYYVEDGWVRGFAVVSRVALRMVDLRCKSTGRLWPPGFYCHMSASSWRWIKPKRMLGFRGFRYATFAFLASIEVVGGWRDPRPETPP